MSRRVHCFHRFAHHPLCDAYASEVIRLGRRTRICRGCAAVMGGAALGGIVVFLLPLGWGGAAAGLALVMGSLAIAVGLRLKLATRALPGFGVVGVGGVGVQLGGFLGWGLVSLVGLLASLFILRYRRRGPDRRLCQACPHRNQPPACPGYLDAFRRERAFGRLAGRWLTRHA